MTTPAPVGAVTAHPPADPAVYRIIAANPDCMGSDGQPSDSLSMPTRSHPEHHADPDAGPLFVTSPRNLEDLLVAEMTALGAHEARPGPAGAACLPDLALAYRLCLWSRLGSRVLWPLAMLPATDAATLHAAAEAFPWETHLPGGTAFAFQVTGHSPSLRDSRHTARVLKDAVLDRARGRGGALPQPAPRAAALTFHARLHQDRIRLSLDLAGASLHRRGYRAGGGRAPLKENLAAGMLIRAGWPQIAADGGQFLDPFCGSGTLVIEAALMAADMAPGLLRDTFGFAAWPGHDARLWASLRTEAEARREAGVAACTLTLRGADADPAIIREANRNAERAGVAGLVHFETRALAEQPRSVAPPAPGLLATNPPYGARLGAAEPVEDLYIALGDWLRTALPGWRAAVLTGEPRLLAALGLSAERTHPLFNGALRCRLGLYRLYGPAPGSATPAPEAAPAAPEALVNRLRKNRRHLTRWCRREGVDAYRLYDADLPEFNLAVDVFATDQGTYAHVQEYQAPADVSPRRARSRREAALAAVREVLGLPVEQVVLKVRRRGGGYRAASPPAGIGGIVAEHGCRLRVELAGQLDGGLFLDHRPLRRRLQAEAAGRRFLNLFAYTGSATVYAAVGGARQTTSVDQSRRYLDWAAENLALNGFQAGRGHELVRADCLHWLAMAPAAHWDLILLDTPTRSAGHGRTSELEIQRDHVALIRSALRCLAPGGTLYFSCNYRRFRLDAAALADCRITPLTGAASLDPDFRRSPRIHHLWAITRGRD